VFSSILVVAMSLVPAARAQPAEEPTLSLPDSKLDLQIFTPAVKTDRMSEQPYAYGFGARFGGPASGWTLFGGIAEGALFSLAVINAFIPRWLPKGAARRLNLNGTGGFAPSDVGFGDGGMGYSDHH
jgi:hypothetical protein